MRSSNGSAGYNDLGSGVLKTNQRVPNENVNGPRTHRDQLDPRAINDKCYTSGDNISL